MKIIKRVNQIAGISFILSLAVCAIVGRMFLSKAGEPPTIIIICTAIILIDIFWFIFRGLALFVNELFDK